MGKTNKNQVCTKKCTKGNKYCHYHKSQNVEIEKKSESDSTKKHEISSEEDECTIVNEKSGPCSICLLEVEVDELFSMDCGHKHHSQCIKSWLESSSIHSQTCPVCRTPITNSDIINEEIKLKNIMSFRQERIEEDERIAREMTREDENSGENEDDENEIPMDIHIGNSNIGNNGRSHYSSRRIRHTRVNRDDEDDDIVNINHNHTNNNRDTDLELAIQASLEMVDENEYNITAEILKDSYYLAGEEEKLLLEMVMNLSIETEKQEREKETIDTTLNRLLKNQPSVILKLKK
jgi:hypothetical protein